MARIRLPTGARGSRCRRAPRGRAAPHARLGLLRRGAAGRGWIPRGPAERVRRGRRSSGGTQAEGRVHLPRLLPVPVVRARRQALARGDRARTRRRRSGPRVDARCSGVDDPASRRARGAAWSRSRGGEAAARAPIERVPGGPLRVPHPAEAAGGPAGRVPPARRRTSRRPSPHGRREPGRAGLPRAGPGPPCGEKRALDRVRRPPDLLAVSEGRRRGGEPPLPHRRRGIWNAGARAGRGTGHDRQQHRIARRASG